jgi:hypothetical protein
MRDVCSLIWLALIGLFRSRASLQTEILTLRHQLSVLRRKSCRLPSVLALEIKTAVAVQRPRWKSGSSFARRVSPTHYRGAPRIHSELLKLGIDVGQTTVAKYMARVRRPPFQGWKTFLHNYAPRASRRWTHSWFRQSHCDCSMGC